jgi:hypothetical protein
MELQWGERRQGAFVTCARVAGSFSISVWLVLLPSGQLLVLAICGRLITKWQHFGYQRKAGQGGSSKSFDQVLVMERCSILRGEFPCLFSIYKYPNNFSGYHLGQVIIETWGSWSGAEALLP